MDRDLASKHLAQAEATVAAGRRHIVEQKLRIKRLAGDGPDVAGAEDFLDILLDIQGQHEAHRDWLKAELGEMVEAQLSSARAG